MTVFGLVFVCVVLSYPFFHVVSAKGPLIESKVLMILIGIHCYTLGIPDYMYLEVSFCMEVKFLLEKQPDMPMLVLWLCRHINYA